jgi:TP901-1 family phage major tail protein
MKGMNFKKFCRRSFKAIMLGCVMAMMLVFSAVTLPDNPSTSSATVGKDYLLYINTGTVAVPVWTLIGGQRSSSLGRTADSIDTSHKTSGGWKSALAGLRGWSIDLDGLVLLNDLGIDALETAFSQGKQVNIKFEYPDKRYQTGWASITDFSMETPHDGEASLSGTLEGNGELSDKIPSITPLSVTVSKASPSDQVFTIAPSTTTISSIKNGATSLTVSTNYTYSSGTLTIKSTYLGGLTVGTQTLTIATGDGATITVVVELTA